MSSPQCSSNSSRRPSSQSMDSTSNSFHLSQSWAPDCLCGDRAVIRTAKTVINYGNKFWGCKHYTKYHPGCDYFDWYYEGITNVKDQTIMRQRSKIEKLKNTVNDLEKLLTDLNNTVTEQMQKLEDANSFINAQKLEAVAVEVENGKKISSLEATIGNYKKWSKVWGIYFAILLVA